MEISEHFDQQKEQLGRHRAMEKGMAPMYNCRPKI
jgi:hypothetical protein